MTADEFRALLTADPFVPFTVHLTGGSTVDVVRPELVTVSPHGSADIRQSNGGRCIIALNHVTAIVPFDVPIIVVSG